jgi:hypothetical protein
LRKRRFAPPFRRAAAGHAQHAGIAKTAAPRHGVAARWPGSCITTSGEEEEDMDRIGALLPIGRGDEDAHHGARRRSRRFPLNAEVAIVEPVPAAGVILNASAGGLRIFVDQEPPAAATCVLEVRFTAESHTVERARVVWKRQTADGWLSGLEFENIDWTIPGGPGLGRAA